MAECIIHIPAKCIESAAGEPEKKRASRATANLFRPSTYISLVGYFYCPAHSLCLSTSNMYSEWKFKTLLLAEWKAKKYKYFMGKILQFRVGTMYAQLTWVAQPTSSPILESWQGHSSTRTGLGLNLNAFCRRPSLFKLCNKLLPGDEFGLSKKRVYLRCHT